MRLPTVTVLTLAALSSGELTKTAIAAPAAPQPAKAAPRSIATPEPVKIQEFSTPKPQALLPADLVVTATDVQILGADAELQQLLRTKIQTQPGGSVSVAQLQSDVAAILDTGLFSSATVDRKPNPNGLSVTFQVQPVIVRSLQIVNAKALPSAIANSFFSHQFNRTVSPSAINQSIRQINDWYAQNNFNLARVVIVTPSREGALTLEVAEGTVSEIQFRFTDDQGKATTGKTRDDFLRTQIQLKPGQVFSEAVARQDLQRLFQTGLFTTGRVALEGDAQQTRVVYVMTEAPAQSVNASGGFSRDLGVYGSLNYGNLNQGGRGQQLSGNVLLGTRDIQVNGQFVRPYRATEPDKLGLRVEGFRQRTDSRTLESTTAPNGDRIREGRFGGSVSVNRPMGEWDASLGLNYQRISLRDQAGNVVPQDAQGRSLSASGTGIDDLTTLNLTAVRDKRNNVIDPTQGSLLRLSTEQSVPIGSGSILSNRVSVNFSEYMPVNLFNLEKTQQQPEVFAYNLQAGTTLGTLPAYNAFALGGPNSVRGYGEGQLGAARSYVAASAEYRFPIYSIVGGAVFADVASNLSTNTGFGAGLGLRLKSPVGTIRASYGFNDRGEGRIQFGIGEKF